MNLLTTIERCPTLPSRVTDTGGQKVKSNLACPTIQFAATADTTLSERTCGISRQRLGQSAIAIIEGGKPPLQVDTALNV